jgi:hypothetical protein
MAATGGESSSSRSPMLPRIYLPADALTATLPLRKSGALLRDLCDSTDGALTSRRGGHRTGYHPLAGFIVWLSRQKKSHAV